MGRRAGRRAFLAAVLGGSALAAKRRVYPSELERYSDRLTEFPVERLTAPGAAARLPIPFCRAVSRRAGFFVYSSARDGTPQLFQLDHKDGRSQQLTEAAALAPTEFTLLPGDRALLFLDGDSLRLLALPSLRERELYRVRAGWQRENWLALTPDGEAAVLLESRDGVREARRVPLRQGGAAGTVLQVGEPVANLLARPGGGWLWISNGKLCAEEGGARRVLPSPPGTVRQAWWAPDGASVPYLHAAPDGRVTVRELEYPSGKGLRSALVTRYIHFAPNSDGSMFVGAGGSPAAPHILLLHRTLRRELTVCEHGCPDPSLAVPVFSPDSRRVYFVSGANGATTVRCIDVSRIVEET